MIRKLISKLNSIIRVKDILFFGKCQIILINPRSNMREEPLGVAYLTSYLEERNIQVKVIDLNVKNFSLHQLSKIIKKSRPLVIGLSAITRQINSAFKIGKYVKSNYPNIKLLYGGVHPTIFPNECFKKGCADIVVIGEGEETAFKVIRNVIEDKTFTNIRGIAYKKQDKVIFNKLRELIKNLDEIPFPARHLLKLKRYKTDLHIKPFINKPSFTIMASRGCPFNCNYCTIPYFWKRKVRFRSADNVVEEIKYVIKKYKIRNIHFHDDDLLINKNFLENFCSLIKKNKIKINWICQAGIRSVIKNKDILIKVKEVGCVGVEIGIESCDNTILKNLNKNQTDKDIIKADQIIRSNSLTPIYLVIAFGVGENIDRIYNSAQLISKIFKEDDYNIISDYHKFVSVPFSHGFFFTPVPGSTFFRIAKEKGKIFARSWNDIYFARVNFIPYSFLNDIPEKRINITKDNFFKNVKRYKLRFLYYFKYYQGLIFDVNNLKKYLEYLNDIYALCNGKDTVESIINKVIRKYPQTSFEQGALGVRFLAMFGLLKSRINAKIKN